MQLTYTKMLSRLYKTDLFKPIYYYNGFQSNSVQSEKKNKKKKKRKEKSFFS